MKKHVLITLVLIAAASCGVVGVVHAATTNISCPATVSDSGANYKVTTTCTFPKAAPVTQTATVTATATVTVTASAPSSQTPTVTPSASLTPTPTPTPTVPPTGDCATSTPNVPDGPDGRGGCFPGLSNTGPTAAAATMATYIGPCTITVANTVIADSVVNCRTIDVRAAGFVLRNSYLFGGIVQGTGTAAFTVVDSLVDSGVQYPACSNGSCPAGKYACGDPKNQTTDCGVTGSNFTITRTEIINSNRAAYCESSCTITDSWFHATTLWPDASNLAHASSVREEQGLTLRHSSLHCSYTGPFVNGEIGCSADLTGYPDFAPIKDNTVDGNLFVASPGSSFCAYGGATGGKPSSSDPTNATNQRFTNNVFQRGSGKCATYGPVTDFGIGRAGNVWSGNVWDDGALAETGTLTAAGTVGTFGTASLAATGTISGAGSVGRSTGATLSSTASLNAAGVVGKVSSANLAGTVAITAAGAVVSGLSGSANLATTGTLTAAGTVAGAGQATVASTATITATGRVGVSAGASLAGTATIATAGIAAPATGSDPDPITITVRDTGHKVTIRSSGTRTTAQTTARATTREPRMRATSREQTQTTVREQH